MEPIRNLEPAPGFLEQTRKICSRIGAGLVVDEVSVGFRLNAGTASIGPNDLRSPG
jgi:glutamate-1-semialdehyde 2,1-aminomutase